MNTSITNYRKLGFRCVGIDTRGFGLSDRPWSGYDYNRLSDDLCAVIEAMQLQNIILGGGIRQADRVCLYPLAIAQKNGIKNAKLVPFESCGHFLFYDQMVRFNTELVQFAEN